MMEQFKSGMESLRKHWRKMLKDPDYLAFLDYVVLHQV